MKKTERKPFALRVRKPVPRKVGRAFVDRKKEASRRACRGRAQE